MANRLVIDVFCIHHVLHVQWLKERSIALEFMNHVIQPPYEISRKMDKNYFLIAHGSIILIISHACHEDIYILQIIRCGIPFILAH